MSRSKEACTQAAKLLGVDVPQSGKSEQDKIIHHNQAGAAEQIVAYLEAIIPEKFEFDSERKHCFHAGQRSVINMLRIKYLKEDK